MRRRRWRMWGFLRVMLSLLHNHHTHQCNARQCNAGSRFYATPAKQPDHSLPVVTALCVSDLFFLRDKVVENQMFPILSQFAPNCPSYHRNVTICSLFVETRRCKVCRLAKTQTTLLSTWKIQISGSPTLQKIEFKSFWKFDFLSTSFILMQKFSRIDIIAKGVLNPDIRTISMSARYVMVVLFIMI